MIIYFTLELLPYLDRCCIRSICTFIENQCKREKKDHTRALHSLIVRAFGCLGTWLVAHPTCLADGPTLRAVVDTIKLGIFGSEAPPAGISQVRKFSTCKKTYLNLVSFILKRLAHLVRAFLPLPL